MAFFELTHPTRIIPDFPLANIVLAAFTGVVLIIDHRNVRLPRVPWTVVTYLALCTASVLWSINRSDTLHLTLLYAWIALFAAICVAQTDTQTLLRGIAWGGVLVVVVTLISVVVDPKRFGSGLLFPGSGPGVHGSRGVVAYSLVLAMAAAVSRQSSTVRKRIEIVVSVIIILVGVAITPAATGRVGAAMVLVGWLVLVVLRRLHGRAFVAVMAGLLAVVVTAIVVGLFNLGEIAAAFGRSPDFSGRFKVWGAIIPAWLGAPVAGYGFGAVWYYGWWRLDGSDLLTRMNYAAGTFFYHGHNLFMDVLPQLGVLGVVSALLVLAVLAARGIAGFRRGSGSSTWALLLLTAVLVMGIAEPMLSVPVGWFSVIAATAAARIPAPDASGNHLPSRLVEGGSSTTLSPRPRHPRMSRRSLGPSETT